MDCCDWCCELQNLFQSYPKFPESLKISSQYTVQTYKLVTFQYIMCYVCCKMGQNGYFYRYCNGYDMIPCYRIVVQLLAQHGLYIHFPQ